jgi:hypothetical protein
MRETEAWPPSQPVNSQLPTLNYPSALYFLIETHSLPNAHSLLPSQLYLDHSHCLVLAPATLAALPSTRAIPDRDVFYVAPPVRSIVSLLRPQHSTATSRLYRPCRSSHFAPFLLLNSYFLFSSLVTHHWSPPVIVQRRVATRREHL